MDPNKGHGENIRTYNWREKGPRRSWTTENTRFPATESSKRGPKRFSFFPLTADECALVADLGAQRTKGVRDPGGPESSWATQPVFGGEAKRQSTPREYLPGGRGSFSNSTLNEVFHP